MPEPFKVEYDDCAVRLTYLDARHGFVVDLSPQQARELAFDLSEKANDCEDLQEREAEQMMG